MLLYWIEELMQLFQKLNNIIVLKQVEDNIACSYSFDYAYVFMRGGAHMKRW